jgi:hypothetical protein
MKATGPARVSALGRRRAARFPAVRRALGAKSDLHNIGDEARTGIRDFCGSLAKRPEKVTSAHGTLLEWVQAEFQEKRSWPYRSAM